MRGQKICFGKGEMIYDRSDHRCADFRRGGNDYYKEDEGYEGGKDQLQRLFWLWRQLRRRRLQRMQPVWLWKRSESRRSCGSKTAAAGNDVPVGGSRLRV